jgi:hypothetical protein
MICVQHQNFKSQTVVSVARRIKIPHSVIVGLVITFAIFTGLLTVDTAKAQSQNNSEILTISFHDFFQRPVGLAGLLLNEQILQAQGRQVRLTGYMVQQEKLAPGRFLLAQRPVLLSQHADGEADDLPPATVLVVLSPEQQDRFVAYTRGVIDVVGELDVGREECTEGKVSWIRLRLSSNGTREMNGIEYLTYKHSMQHKH